MWRQTHVDYDQLVLEKWNKGAGGDGLSGAMQASDTMKTSLSTWGSKEFGCLARKGRKLRQKLEKLRRRSIGHGPNDEDQAIVKQLRENLRREEIWMRQRLRVQRLREGDRNTAFFHAQAAQRKRMNKITELERSDGRKCSTWEESCEEIQEFFQTIYLSQGFRSMDDLLGLVPTRVSPAMNETFEKPYTAEEVRYVLFQMAQSKVPGVDDFTVGFFQQHWMLLGDDLERAILGFLNGG
jgi:hypothetical protein